jgi:hypothetical protein
MSCDRFNLRAKFTLREAREMTAGPSSQPTLFARIDSLLQIRCETPEAYILVDYEQLADDVSLILNDSSFATLSVDARASILQHIHALYSGYWHSSGQRLISTVERALAQLLDDPNRNLDAICIAYDLLFFFYWCWNASIKDQVGFGENVVRPFAKAIRAEASSRSTVFKNSVAPIPVGYLAQFATPSPGNAVALATECVLRALCSDRSRYQPILYAWMFHDDASAAKFEDEGILVRRITGNSPSERIAAAEVAISRDRPEVLISDMNTAVPTVIFERRAAPIQVFYQFGMPFWPIENLDGMFQVWQLDSGQIGFPTRKSFLMSGPSTPERLKPSVDPSRIAAERARFPRGRLIGTYGRLAKITPEFLATIAAAIAQMADVTVVLGGTGDDGPIRRTLDALGVAERFVVIDEYVDGHVWGHILDIFLDTFPQQGGQSCREVIAKGKPVVSMFSTEMPNLSTERVEYLVARAPADYARILQQLLDDPTFYRKASEDTSVLAHSGPTEADYAAALLRAIGTLRLRWRSMKVQTAVQARSTLPVSTRFRNGFPADT